MGQSNVLIIGGGAAGLTAAIASARLGATVTVLERGTRVGKKVLESGNGRCNLTNLSVSPSAYNHPDFVEPVVAAYPYEAIHTFFSQLGLLTRADDEGRVYPLTNAASSVLEVLRLECAHLGVEVRCGFAVRHLSVKPGAAGFQVLSQDGEELCARSVVVTTGGGGSLLGDVGHQLVERVPVLGPIRTDTGLIRGLSGVRVRCKATLLAGVSDDGTGGDVVATERGELLFRDYGVSGIMIFDLSRHLRDGCALSIDLFPDLSQSQLQTMLEQRRADLPWRSAETFFVGMLHDRVARAVLRAAGIDPNISAEKLSGPRLAAVLKDLRLAVVGMADGRKAQVTRGGASVAQFDPDTMASRVVDGLFAAGEVLDIDGRSGGFNLHWAWASGIVAGQVAARVAGASAAWGDVDSGGSV